MSRNALGRGLSALLPETRPAAKTPPPAPQPSPEAPGPTRIPVEKVRPNRYQPRQSIDPEAVRELAESIKVHGLLQPIIVTFDAEEDEYELIAGERRLDGKTRLDGQPEKGRKGLERLGRRSDPPRHSVEIEKDRRFAVGLLEDVEEEEPPVENGLDAGVRPEVIDRGGDDEGVGVRDLTEEEGHVVLHRTLPAHDTSVAGPAPSYLQRCEPQEPQPVRFRGVPGHLLGEGIAISEDPR